VKRSLLLLGVVWLTACGDPVDPPALTPPPAATRDAPSPPKAVALSSRLSYPAATRLVAIGDLHGDLEAAKKALRLARAIDASDTWIGGKLVVVQTGDVLDRGDADRDVLDFLGDLKEAAERAGGAVILLSGNHEFMNVARDFRYVTPGGFTAFVDANGRGAAFQPGGPYAQKLAQRPFMARVGDTLFVHGGILPKHVRYGLDRMHDEAKAWMLGQRAVPPEIMQAEDAPVWSRAYSDAPDAAACAALNEVLTSLESKRMVVGHTVQKAGISTACEERVFRIDVGLAKFYGGPMQVLEIQDGKVSILRE